MIAIGLHDEPKARPARGRSGVLAYVSVIGCLGAGVIAHSLWQLTRGPFEPSRVSIALNAAGSW